MTAIAPPVVEMRCDGDFHPDGVLSLEGREGRKKGKEERRSKEGRKEEKEGREGRKRRKEETEVKKEGRKIER
jgi:hypothetical protein